MTTYPRVAFVSGPDVGATIRLDLNDAIGGAGCQVNADDFTLGAPTLDGDPTAVGQVWGYRSITLTPRLTGAKAAALAALSAISREQLRAENWLLFQLDASTDPVWFKTYRSSPQPVSLEDVDASGRRTDAWQATLTLTADAFAYGARETLSSVTFGSSLVATNPMRYALPAIRGDAPTPLRITLNATTGNLRTARIAVVAADATVADPVYDIGVGDGFSADPGLADTNTNSAYLGGSYRNVPIAATANNLIARLSGSATPTAGRYKVLLRCQADPINSTTPNQYSFAFGQVSGVDPDYAQTVTLDTPAYNGVSADTFRGWVDLGEFTFPRNANVPPDLSPTQPASGWTLKVGTPAGVVGTVRLDALKFVPVSGPTIRAVTLLRTTRANSAYFLPSGSTAVNWDGDTESAWGHTVSSGTLLSNDLAYEQSGGFPVADPAATQNLLLTLLDGTASDATGVWTVVVSYYPRFLHVGDGT